MNNYTLERGAMLSVSGKMPIRPLLNIALVPEPDLSTALLVRAWQTGRVQQNPVMLMASHDVVSIPALIRRVMRLNGKLHMVLSSVCLLRVHRLAALELLRLTCSLRLTFRALVR